MADTTQKITELLVQVDENTQEASSIDASLIVSSNQESFEQHATDTAKHVPSSTEDGKVLVSKNGADAEWTDTITVNLTAESTAVTADNTTNDTSIATTAFVQTLLNASKTQLQQDMSNGMRIIGNLGTPSTSDEPGNLEQIPTSAKQGDAYYVTTENTYAGHECEVGDLIVCRKTYTNQNQSDANWFVIQKNLINALVAPKTTTTDNLVSFKDATGTEAKDSGLSTADVKSLTDNKETLTKLSTDATSGGLLFNGQPIGNVMRVSSAQEAQNAHAAVGTLFFVTVPNTNS